VRFLLLGQFDGFVILGLVLLDWGLQQQHDWVAGLGLSLALIKPQLGLPLATYFLLRRRRFWPLLVLAGIAVLSILLWPGWPRDLLTRLQQEPPIRLGNVSLWPFMGSGALLLWLPATLLPMPPARRQTLLAATSALALPYFQSHSLMLLYVMPIGLLPLLANIGFLSVLGNESALTLQAVVPMGVYVWMVGLTARELWGRLHSGAPSH